MINGTYTKDKLLITEATIPMPSRIMMVKNKATSAGKKALKELLPDSFKTHDEATKRTKDYIKDYHQVDYRTDTKIIDDKVYGRLIMVFTVFYWYKGISPEVTTISFSLKGTHGIDVYDFLVDTATFKKEMLSKYRIKAYGRLFIPIESKNTKEEKKFPRLVEIGKLAGNYFKSLPIVEDEAPKGYGNSMSFLSSKTDQKRLYDYQFFEWNQFFEAEHFAKKYFIQGYDVCVGQSSLKTNSVMIYILKPLKAEPIPIFKKKYFFRPYGGTWFPDWYKGGIGKKEGDIR